MFRRPRGRRKRLEAGPLLVADRRLAVLDRGGRRRLLVSGGHRHVCGRVRARHAVAGKPGCDGACRLAAVGLEPVQPHGRHRRGDASRVRGARDSRPRRGSLGARHGRRGRARLRGTGGRCAPRSAHVPREPSAAAAQPAGVTDRRAHGPRQTAAADERRRRRHGGSRRRPAADAAVLRSGPLQGLQRQLWAQRR